MYINASIVIQLCTAYVCAIKMKKKTIDYHLKWIQICKNHENQRFCNFFGQVKAASKQR